MKATLQNSDSIRGKLKRCRNDQDVHPSKARLNSQRKRTRTSPLNKNDQSSVISDFHSSIDEESTPQTSLFRRSSRLHKTTAAPLLTPTSRTSKRIKSARSRTAYNDHSPVLHTPSQDCSANKRSTSNESIAKKLDFETADDNCNNNDNNNDLNNASKSPTITTTTATTMSNYNATIHTHSSPTQTATQPQPVSPSEQPFFSHNNDSYEMILTPLQQAIKSHALSTGQSTRDIWQHAQRAMVLELLQQLLSHLRQGPPTSPALPGATCFSSKQPTTGISYVIPTESAQKGLPADVPRLPHLVFRPPGISLLPKTHPRVASVLSTLTHEPSLTVVLPLKDENMVKSYLLCAAARWNVVQSHGGQIESIKGMKGLLPLLSDKMFVCMHYKLETTSDGGCLVSPVSGFFNTPNRTSNHGTVHIGDGSIATAHAASTSLSSSDIQIGIILRRGIGGTSSLRSVARKEGIKHILSSLLDDIPEVISTVPQQSLQSKGQGSSPHMRICGNNDSDENQSQDNDHQIPLFGGSDHLNFATLCMRLEMYVDHAQWSSLDRATQSVLFSAIRHYEQDFNDYLIAHSWQRLAHSCTQVYTQLLQQQQQQQQQENNSMAVLSSALVNKLLPHVSLREAWRDAITKGKPPNDCVVKVHLKIIHMPSCGEKVSVVFDIISTSHIDTAISTTTFAAPLHGTSLPPNVFLVPVMIKGHPKPFLVPMRRIQQQQINYNQAQNGDGQSAAVPAATSASMLLAIKGGKTSICFDFPTAVVLTAACLSACNKSSQIPWPLYLIGTRDCFTHHLVPVKATMPSITDGYPDSIVKIEWYFKAEEVPADYDHILVTYNDPGNDGQYLDDNEKKDDRIDPVIMALVDGMVAAIHNSFHDDIAMNGQRKQARASDRLLPVGVTTYHDVYSLHHLVAIEKASDGVDKAAREGKLPQSCFHSSFGKGGTLKRTKFFFGARYLWTREQLSSPHAAVALGVRVDVPPPPPWTKDLVETPLVKNSILPLDFIDSVALNMYHDGSEGIQSHYDDSQRFHQPIYSLRLFSDSRLSFGTQLYGYTNGAFCIPMPRGGITVMESGSYAANGVKHCVRPTDMSIKSASVILRKINTRAIAEAREYYMEESIRWLSGVSISHDDSSPSIDNPYYHQHGTNNATLTDTRAALKEKRTRQHKQENKPISMKIKKQVAIVMENMLKAIEAAHLKRKNDAKSDAKSVAVVLANIVLRVERADRLKIDISTVESATAFSILDTIVSYCEHGHLLRDNPSTQQRIPSSRKRKPSELQSCVDSKRSREGTVDVAVVMARMLSHIETVNAWEKEGRQGPCPRYTSTVDHIPAVRLSPSQLLIMAQCITSRSLAGLPLLSEKSGEQLPPGWQMIQIATFAMMKRCRIRTYEELKRVLMTAMGCHQSQTTSLTAQQYQAAVAYTYRELHSVYCGGSRSLT